MLDGAFLSPLPNAGLRFSTGPFEHGNVLDDWLRPAASTVRSARRSGGAPDAPLRGGSVQNRPEGLPRDPGCPSIQPGWLHQGRPGSAGWVSEEDSMHLFAAA